MGKGYLFVAVTLVVKNAANRAEIIMICFILQIESSSWVNMFTKSVTYTCKDAKFDFQVEYKP